MTDREKKSDFDSDKQFEKKYDENVSDLPAQDAAQDENVKGGQYWRPVMLGPKPEQ